MVCSHEGTYSTSNMYVYVSLLIKRTLRWLSETQITLDMLVCSCVESLGLKTKLKIKLKCPHV